MREERRNTIAARVRALVSDRPPRALLRLLIVVVAIANLHVSGWCAMDTIAAPVLVIAKTDQPPVIDGVLDDEAWSAAAAIYGLQRSGDGEPAEDYTETWLTYDDECFYVAAKCHAATRHHEGIAEDWRRHERLVVDWRLGGPETPYFALKLDSANGPEVTAPNGPPEWWGEGCRLKVRFEDAGWQFEAAVPFARLGIGSPQDGAVWGFNLDRQERKRREDDSGWCQPYVKMDYETERMGEIVLGGADALSVSVVSAGDRQIGGNSLTLGLQNRSAAEAELVARVSVKGMRAQEHALHVGPREKRQVSVPYTVKDGGGEFALTVTDATTGEVVCRYGAALNLAPNKARLRQLGRQLRALTACARGRGALLADLEARRKGLWEAANAPSVSRADWERLTREVQSLALAVSKLAFSAGRNAPALPYDVCVYGPLVTVFRDDALPRNPAPALELAACRNEREVGQLVVLPIEGELRGVRVEGSDLVGAEGRIARENVEMNVVDYVEVKRTRYRQERLGWYPDPLLPLGLFDVAEDSLQPVWVAVYVPRGTPPGDYEGEIRVKPANAPALTVPVRLRVWDFELPVRPALRTSFALFEDQINKFYGWTGDLPQELRRQHYDLLLKRRISAGCCYSETPMPRIEDLDYCIERGSNAITLGYVPSDWKAKLDQIEPYLAHLKEKGWFDLAWLYGFDEVGESGYGHVREIYGKVAERFPGLKRAVTLGSIADPDLLAGAVDIFIQETDRYRDDLKRRQKAGDEVWVYLSMWPRHPHANAFVDYPRLDQRIVPWQCWKERVDGFMYYAINIWWTNCAWEPDTQGDSRVPEDPAVRQALREGKRYPDVPWNTYCGDGAMAGDGQLVYPGRSGRLLSSTRLECVSQGIEDYDYLALLNGLTQELRAKDTQGQYAEVLRRSEELLAVRRRVTADWTHYTKDPAVLEAERRALAQQILQVQRLLPETP